MASDIWNKEEAEEIIKAVRRLADDLPKSKVGEYIGDLNDVYLFLEEAKRQAPEKEKDII